MFVLPELKYSFESLEPHIDTLTMTIHHDKHHATYVKNLNDLLPDKSDADLESILKNLTDIPEAIRTKVRNNGGGHWNHSLFWQILSPTPKAISAQFSEIISNQFGSVVEFKEKFTAAALGRFGSGWAWLVKNGDKLEIVDTPNQDTPLMDGKQVLFGLDVWEHAYYLKYQNRRADYNNAFWQILDWSVVEDRFK